MKKCIVALLALALAWFPTYAERESSFINTIEGVGDNLPPRYVMPLLSNGDLNIHFDVQGTMNQIKGQPVDVVQWAGRRNGPPYDKLYPFGKYCQVISYGGKSYTLPDTWSQTLDTKHAMMTCENTYGDALAVKTEIIVHALKDIVAIRKTFRALKPLPGPVSCQFRYDLSEKEDQFVMPHHMNFSPRWNPENTALDISYSTYGYRDFNGLIRLFADREVTADESLENLSLTTEVLPQVNQPVSVTFYLLYSDDLSTPEYTKEINDYQTLAKENGFDGLAESHKKVWSGYWEKASVDIPDEKIERAYVGGIYQLLANATKWSFPVGISNRLWAGRYFAFDETCCYLGLASSNHLDIARRAPDFRFKTLPMANGRITVNTGAKYPWESTENGIEGMNQPYHHSIFHVFHMSHIATAAWTHYLYTHDKDYLRKTAFPVMKDCARFFQNHMCYSHPDGTVTFGRTTDLERLGAGIENPFFSSCGAIYTFEITLQAAAILGIQGPMYEEFARLAAGLRKTLPNDGTKYVPYQGCKEKSIAVVTGMYPYPVLSTDDPLERAAIQDFYDDRYSAGNMYAVGSGLCPWYASWIASAMANYGIRDKSLSLLQEAAAQIGYFSEHFEINEDKVVMRPWFTTAAGNFVHAVDQILLFNREDDVYVCYSAPLEWKDYSFTLPCYGNMLIHVEVKDGQLRKCDVTKNIWSDSCREKTFWIPTALVDRKKIQKDVLPLLEEAGDYYKIKLDLSDGKTWSLLKNRK